MTEPTTARQVDPRLMITLNSALMPPRPRYRKKTKEELKKMEPLDELPDVLIPHAIPSLIRMPPLLRRGYPLTRDVFAHFIEKDGRFTKGVPVPGGDFYVNGILSTQKAIQWIIGWPTNCHFVYGIPTDNSDGLLFELGNSYSIQSIAPPEVEENLRKALRAEGPPKWYLDDSEMAHWDWKDWENFETMKPLDELPEVLIPGRSGGIGQPPLLRLGYPLTRAVLVDFMKNDGRYVEPKCEPPGLGSALYRSGLPSMQTAVEQDVGWPVRYHYVYGLPPDYPDGVLFELSNSFNLLKDIEMGDKAPPEVEEKLRKVLRMEGPPKWYLDRSELAYWDWKVVCENYSQFYDDPVGVV